MLIVDGHLDLAHNALGLNRNLQLSAYTIRLHEISTPGKGRAQGMVALPQMRQGRVALCFTTLVAKNSGTIIPHLDYGSVAMAYGAAQGQLGYYRALEKLGEIRILTNRRQLDQHLAEWEAWDVAHPEPSDNTPPLGMVLLMECADPILEPAELEEWAEAGLRMIGLSHFGPGRYAAGNGIQSGLTPRGPLLLREMERFGVLLDLTHLSDEAFWEALTHYKGPLLASHTNARALVPNQRHFDDAQITAVIERGGVIGINFGCSDLVAGWIIGHSSNQHVTLETVADHMDHICQLAGNSRHVAIGTDMDGGVGSNEFPADTDMIDHLQRLATTLSARGYNPTDVENILSANWVRLLRKAWKE